jgi:hypothetical protein
VKINEARTGDGSEGVDTAVVGYVKGAVVVRLRARTLPAGGVLNRKCALYGLRSPEAWSAAPGQVSETQKGWPLVSVGMANSPAMLLG